MGAHPDDAEILLAGTLAHYARQGAHITIAVLTDGRLGSRVLPPERTAALRRDEATCAAEVLGAELTWVGLPDGFLYDTPETRVHVVDVVRACRPDVVFAHQPGDYHPDHRAASELVAAARLLAREPALVTDRPATDTVAPLFYMDTLTGRNAGTPDLWVDVTDTMTAKEAMLAKHISQNEGRRRRRGSDFVDLAREQSAWRGRQVGTRYAEALTCAPAHPATGAEDLTPPGSGVTLPCLRPTRRPEERPG